MNNDTGIFAPTSNMRLIHEGFQIAVKAKPGTQRIVTVHGPSGIGKTIAAISAGAKANAVYLRVREVDTKSSLLQRLAIKAGVLKVAQSSHIVLDQIVAALIQSRRPIVLDEFDNSKDRQMIGAVRDIYEDTQVPILIVGEEAMPAMLNSYERFDNRIVATIAAQPMSLIDGRLLRDQYANGVTIADDLVDYFTEQCLGGARRIVNNIYAATRVSIEELEGKAIDLKSWGARPVATGVVPSRRF